MDFSEARHIQTINTVSVTLTISDGDTGLNNFDYDNIDILLNDVTIGLNGKSFQ